MFLKWIAVRLMKAQRRSRDFLNVKWNISLVGTWTNHQRTSLRTSESGCKYRVSFTAVINTVGHGKLPRLEF